MVAIKRRVLLVGGDAPVVRRAQPLLAGSPIEASFAEGRDDFEGGLGAGTFDLVVAHVPLRGMTLADLVRRVRRGADGGPRLILVASPELAPAVGTFLGRGVDRVVSPDAASSRLVEVIGELLGTRIRSGIRASVTLTLRLGTTAHELETETINLSTAGMLVRGGYGMAVGTVVSFELVLPGTAGRVRGTGRVVRRADPEAEPAAGVGVSFLDLPGRDRAILAAFLDRFGD